MNGQYLNILIESLHKKIDVLEEIERISNRQSEIVAAQPVNYEEFDRCVDDKEVCLEQLSSLDEGFESLYSRVGSELENNKLLYADQIKECQKLIAVIMDKSVAIQSLEARNKQKIEEIFRKERKSFNKGKRSVEVARNYYKNMNNTNVITPHFMDQKK